MKNALRILILFLLIVGSAFSADKRVSIPMDNAPSMGPDNAAVTIVEFIDFQ
jgi:hypothetical protein